jgi:hypothetical protein
MYRMRGGGGTFGPILFSVLAVLDGLFEDELFNRLRKKGGKEGRKEGRTEGRKDGRMDGRKEGS